MSVETLREMFVEDDRRRQPGEYLPGCGGPVFCAAIWPAWPLAPL